ncbi:MAG: hypothetical protein RLZ33_1127 [Bacteroidota bacterium]|jgi:hypothetical protein
MRYLLHFFFLILVQSAFAQQVEADFYLKKSIKQEGKLYVFYVQDEDKKPVGHFDQDKFYFWYKAQVVKQTQGAASGQLLHGLYEVFYSNKQLAEKGRFRKGLKQGEWLYWREDGTLIRSEHWSHGKMVGTLQVFNEKGELVEEKKMKRFSFGKKEKSDSTDHSIKTKEAKEEKATKEKEVAREKHSIFWEKEASAKEKTPSPFWLKVKGLFHKKEKSTSKKSKNAA